MASMRVESSGYQTALRRAEMTVATTDVSSGYRTVLRRAEMMVATTDVSWGLMKVKLMGCWSGANWALLIH
jgi:hypothetical protein